MNGKKIPINTDPPEFHVVDKRHSYEEEVTGGDAPPLGEGKKPRYPTFVEELMARLAEVEKRFEQKKSEMMQEVSRTRTRLEADYTKRLALEKHKLLVPFLDVLDNLQRAVQSGSAGGDCRQLYEGVKLTCALFAAKLQAQGIEPIEVMNQPFDPEVSEAVGVVPVSNPEQDGVVVEEVQHGFRMGDQLVRPAQVRVGRFE